MVLRLRSGLVVVSCSDRCSLLRGGSGEVLWALQVNAVPEAS
jgi:hypothetical protein